MPQISKNLLSKTAKDLAFQRLIYLFAHEDREAESKLLFNSLLTDTEQVMVIKRLTAFILIMNHWDAGSIAKLLKMSKATIYSFKRHLALNRNLTTYLNKRFPKPIKPKTGLKPPELLINILNFLEDIHIGYHHRSRLYYGRNK